MSEAAEAPKTAVVVRDTPRGRIKGTKLEVVSPAQVAANRVNAWKTGKYAKTATLLEARTRKLAERDPEIVGLTEAYLEALESGSLEHPNAIAALSLAEQETRRRQITDSINETGVLVEESMFDKDGKEIGVRVKANPLLEHERQLSVTLGHTAAEMQLTRKSRGEGDKDAAIAAMARRDAMLREMPKAALPPPPEDE